MSDGLFFDDSGQLDGLWDSSFASEPSASVLCGLTDCHQGLPGVSGLTLSLEGNFYDLGDARLDADGDGASDSVTLSDDHGLTVYTDSDGDGMVDRVTTVRFDGGYASWAMDSSDDEDRDHHRGGDGNGDTGNGHGHRSGYEMSRRLLSGDMGAHPGGEKNHKRGDAGEASKDRDAVVAHRDSSRPHQCVEAWTRGRWECLERGNWG
ncbi:DUF6802 family protein [Corynebacterium kroppenstedtii]|uniref:DUF6802 family protein n=1 Tax=Corynebacterium sp. PCR 32 TaxID=3351342 RepID=UPI00309A4688